MAITQAQEKAAEQLIGLLAQVIPPLIATYKHILATHSGPAYPPLEELVAQGEAIFDGIKATAATEIADAKARIANEAEPPVDSPAPPSVPDATGADSA